MCESYRYLLGYGQERYSCHVLSPCAIKHILVLWMCKQYLLFFLKPGLPQMYTFLVWFVHKLICFNFWPVPPETHMQVWISQRCQKVWISQRWQKSWQRMSFCHFCFLNCFLPKVFGCCMSRKIFSSSKLKKFNVLICIDSFVWNLPEGILSQISCHLWPIHTCMCVREGTSQKLKQINLCTVHT